MTGEGGALNSLRIAFLASVLGVCAPALSGQAVPQLRLKPADATLDEEFTAIRSVRELSDGRLLISDTRDNRVVVADMRTGAVSQVGRVGNGPGEYAQASTILASTGDSSLMFDSRGGRLHLFDGAQFVGSLPPDAPIVKAVQRSAVGADAHGNVWRVALDIPAGGAAAPGGAGDSSFLIRANRATAGVDTLARVKRAATNVRTFTNAKGEVTAMSISILPLSVGDEAAMFADGWFAISRVDPYRVDWITPDGRMTKGPPLPFEKIKVTNREIEAYFLARSRGAPAASGRVPDVVRDAVREQAAVAAKSFPAVYPPFVINGVIAASDGRAIIRRPETADKPNARYDVVDRAGRLVGTIEMAKGERLAAVTKAYAYVVWKDDDDIERLRRHPVPR